MELKEQTDTHTPERTSTDCVFMPKPVAPMLMTGSSRSTFIPLSAKSRSLNILTWGVMKSYRRTQNHEMTYNFLIPRIHQCMSEKHKATHSLLMWGGYAVNCLFNINLELFCFRNGLRVHTANTGRIDWSLSSSPPQSVKSAYSPSSRRYWRPSNPGAEYPTQLCMNKKMNHCLSQLKAINQQELRPTKPNPTTSVSLSKKGVHSQATQDLQWTDRTESLSPGVVWTLSLLFFIFLLLFLSFIKVVNVPFDLYVLPLEHWIFKEYCLISDREKHFTASCKITLSKTWSNMNHLSKLKQFKISV